MVCLQTIFSIDEIFNQCLVGGKFAQRHVPINLRHLLSAESAANDGLAYPFLTLAIYLTVDNAGSTAMAHWILIGCLCEPFSQLPHPILSLTLIPKDQVFFGVVLGSILGGYLTFGLDIV